MPTWNDEQRKAIYTQHKNVLVSASAGAGKTTVLIARLIELVVHERISIEHILAMTFTDAAANEMKKRLAAELHRLYQESEDKAEKQYILEQLTALGNAHISTIHSFCLSVIQEYYYMIDLAPEAINAVMDDAQVKLAKNKAMDEVFQHQYRLQDCAFDQLCAMFSSRSEDTEALRDAILTIAAAANSQSDSDRWFEHCIDLYQSCVALDQLPDEIQAPFFAYFQVRLDQYQEACEALYRLYQSAYSKETKKLQSMQTKCSSIAAVSACLAKHDYMGFKQAFIASCHVVAPASPDKSDLIYEQYRKRILGLEDELLATLYDETVLMADLQDSKPLIHKLIEMSRDYLHHYAQIKKANNGIDFDDMEHFALQILRCNQGVVADHYRSLFAHIMVDEFQDSNDVQNELVNLISRGDNVFRVGDIKQSIYGFRHAKPQLMRGLIDHADEHDEVIYLSHNYRSKTEIVSFNNELFKELMNLPGFSCRYTKADDVQIGIEAQKQGGQPILFHALDLASIREDMDRNISTNECKADYIASQIVAIKEAQQLHWKDFVVLVRANARKKDMKQVLDAWHIPCFIDVAQGFYQSEAIQIILSALYAMVDPYDEIHFIAAMTSPLFNYSMQSIADIRIAKQNAPYYAYMKEQQLSGMEAFEALRQMIHHHAICDILNALYAQADFYELYTNQQERANLDLLYDQAIAFEQEHPHNLSAFLHSIDQIKDMESSEAMPIGSEDDVVRVMSIHQSKGLQFPVVFLWSNSRQSTPDAQSMLLCDSDLGIALSHVESGKRFVRPSIHRIAIAHKQNKEKLEEEMRILYVATTRAQQQLHIVDCIKDLHAYAGALSASVVYGGYGYSAWLLHSKLAQEHHSLLNIKEVTHAWQKEIQAERISADTQLAYYEGEDPLWRIVTPSSAKQTQLPQLSFSAQRSMRHGTQMHAYMEALPKTPWLKQDYEGLQPQPSHNDLLALQALNENALFRKANTYAQVYHEYPFSVALEQEIIHGYIDFLAIDKDIILIDFKTDSGLSEQELLKRYQPQLSAYTKAIQSLYPDKQIHTYIYAFALHKEIEATIFVNG